MDISSKKMIIRTVQRKEVVIKGREERENYRESERISVCERERERKERGKGKEKGEREREREREREEREGKGRESVCV